MRRFNPEKELYKIQYGNKNKIIIFVFLLLIVGVIGYSFALYQVRYSKRIIYTKVAPFSSKDLNLAVYVNGEKQNKALEKGSGYKFLDMICDTSYEGTITWDDTKALLSFNQLQITIPNKCNVYLVDNNYDGIKTFEYSGDAQEYTVAKDGLYKIELWGAGGGNNSSFPNDLPGLGGYTSGIIHLNQNEKLYFYIGEKGKTGIIGANKLNGITFNGGGSGIGSTDNNDGGGSGGGATDVRLEKGTSWDDFSSLKSRIIVAGGGGGSTAAMANTIVSGSGGGLTGVGDTWRYIYGKLDGRFNATQTTGYKFGIGENGSANESGGGGAGGGYYGGNSDNISPVRGGAGGGSSFISGHQGCLAIDKSSLENNITLKNGCTTDSNSLECSIHYSNYRFKHTVMIDGLGYQWTDKQGSYVGMPTFDGSSTMQGNTSNGYAKITYLSPA